GNANAPDLCERKEDSESVRRHPGECGRGSALCLRHGNGVRRSWPSPEGSIRVQKACSGEHHCRHAPTLTAHSVNRDQVHCEGAIASRPLSVARKGSRGPFEELRAAPVVPFCSAEVGNFHSALDTFGQLKRKPQTTDRVGCIGNIRIAAR